MTKSMRLPLLGAHMSISGGLDQALYAGAAIGCTCVQLFTHSNRQWKMRALQPEEITAFATARTTTKIKSIAVHASYLINIASPSRSVYKQSVTALINELLRCEQLAIPFLILHPGSAVTSSRHSSITQAAETLCQVLEEVPHHHTTLLLENMAGQGSVIGNTLEELAAIRSNGTHQKRIGFCIDTCHAFAAGYDITTTVGYEHFWQAYDSLLGAESLQVIHLNDSLKGLGSRVDRHTNIGKGQIGLETFRRVMQDPRFTNIPKIIETPHTTPADDAQNLAVLMSLL